MSRRIYPSGPIPAVGAFIVRDGKLLLIRRAFEPNIGEWSVPGGVVELGERVSEAVKREVKEELGIDVNVLRFFDIYDAITRDEAGNVKYHYIIIEFLAKPLSLEVKPSKEVLEYGWFGRGEIDEVKGLSRCVGEMIRRHPEIFKV